MSPVAAARTRRTCGGDGGRGDVVAGGDRGEGAGRLAGQAVVVQHHPDPVPPQRPEHLVHQQGHHRGRGRPWRRGLLVGHPANATHTRRRDPVVYVFFQVVHRWARRRPGRRPMRAGAHPGRASSASGGSADIRCSSAGGRLARTAGNPKDVPSSRPSHSSRLARWAWFAIAQGRPRRQPRWGAHGGGPAITLWGQVKWAMRGAWSEAGASRRAFGLVPMLAGRSTWASTETQPGEQGVADQDVVDQFGLALEDPGVAVLCRDLRGEVPQPDGVALVGVVEPAGAVLASRAARTASGWSPPAGCRSDRRARSAAGPGRARPGSAVAATRTVAASAARRYRAYAPNLARWSSSVGANRPPGRSAASTSDAP